MNEEKKHEIERLVVDYYNKTMRYKALGMMNMPSDQEEAKKWTTEYFLAQKEMIEADHALKASVDEL